MPAELRQPIHAGYLVIVDGLTRDETHRLADTLSGIAADILKGETRKRGPIPIVIESDAGWEPEVQRP